MGQKGKGCVYKQDDRFYFQMRVNGVRKVTPLTAMEAKAANKEADSFRSLWASKSLNELERTIAKARNLIESKNLLLEEVWNMYLKNPTRPDSGEGTLSNYSTQWNAFLRWIKEVHPSIATLDLVSNEIAGDYARKLWDVDNFSSSTFNQHIKTLRLITKIVGKHSILRNPWEEIQLKNEIKQKRLDFTPEEVSKILKWFDGKDKFRDKEELKTLFYIGAHTGLRLESAIRLAWSDIDLKNGVITCMPAKTVRIQRIVKIPLHPVLRAELERLPFRKGYLMPSLKARYEKKSEGKVSLDIIKIIERCGFKERNRPKQKDGEEDTGRGINRRLYGFHSFRHAYASACANAGVPITTLAEILGDSIATLQKYYMHAQSEAREKVFSALAPSNAKAKLLAELSTKMQDASIPTLKKIKALL